MYVCVGTYSRRWTDQWFWGHQPAGKKGPRYTWFYDLHFGGMWRQQEIPNVKKEPDIAGYYGRPHLVDPAGAVVGFGGALEPHDSRFFPGEVYFSRYDIYKNQL